MLDYLIVGAHGRSKWQTQLHVIADALVLYCCNVAHDKANI